jgi:hypothetical protein
LGLHPEPEPDWIAQGLKPDFFCDGIHPAWVEVKTLDLSKESQAFGRAWDDLHRRADKIDGFGEAHALIGPAFDDQASAALMGCVSRELRRASSAPIRIVAVPADPDFGRWARITYSCDGNTVEQVGPASASGSYPSYPSCEPDWSKRIKLVLSDGTTREDHAYRILNVSAGKVALRLFWSQTPFKIASASMFEATRNRSNQRVRDAIDEANDQIRNGQIYRRAPGVVCVYQENLDALGGHTLLSAIFGDLTVPIDRDSKKMGEAFLGRNGILKPDQNRGISAVCYTGYGGNSTFIVNPWADYAVQWQLFASEAYVMQGSNVSLCRRD